VGSRLLYETDGPVDEVDPGPNDALSGNSRLDAKTFGLMTALQVLTAAVLLWIRRRSWTDHNVIDSGVTLWGGRIPTLSRVIRAKIGIRDAAGAE
jgi:hypothetical protein